MISAKDQIQTRENRKKKGDLKKNII